MNPFTLPPPPFKYAVLPVLCLGLIVLSPNNIIGMVIAGGAGLLLVLSNKLIYWAGVRQGITEGITLAQKVVQDHVNKETK